MDRRRFVRAAGLLATGVTTATAGCSGGDDSSDGGGGANDQQSPTPTAEDEATVEGNSSEESGGLTVVSSDADSVDEPQTLVVSATVENEGSETRSGIVLGEADVEGRTYTATRQVTLEGGETSDVAVKITYESDKSVITYRGSATIERQQVGQPENPPDTDPANDVVVVEVDADSADAPRTIDFSTTVRNLVDDSRTVTLVGEVDIEDGDTFTGETTVDLWANAEIQERFEVEYESEDSFVSYTYSAWIA